MRLFHFYATAICESVCVRGERRDTLKTSFFIIITPRRSSPREQQRAEQRIEKAAPAAPSSNVCCFQNGRVESRRYTSSRDVIVIYIDCARLLVVAPSFFLFFCSMCLGFKSEEQKYTQVARTQAHGRHQAGDVEKKNSRAKNHYFTSRSSTFFAAALSRCISHHSLLYSSFWANPFNEQLCSCIPMNCRCS